MSQLILSYSCTAMFLKPTAFCRREDDRRNIDSDLHHALEIERDDIVQIEISPQDIGRARAFLLYALHVSGEGFELTENERRVHERTPLRVDYQPVVRHHIRRVGADRCS